ncbi:hypothetical protein [Botryobacter ruber]|nr:hypothetical protein [Botryobacter ruber]
MEGLIIAAALALAGVFYLVYEVYVKGKPRKRKRRFYDHFWP